MNDFSLPRTGPPNAPGVIPIGKRTAVGFSSPADDYLEHPLDLNAHLIRHQAATYFIRSESDTDDNVGIRQNDLLIVDRALTPTDGAIVVAVSVGQLVLRRVRRHAGTIHLEGEEQPELFHDATVESLEIWGIVTYIIRAL